MPPPALDRNAVRPEESSSPPGNGEPWLGAELGRGAAEGGAAKRAAGTSPASRKPRTRDWRIEAGLSETMRTGESAPPRKRGVCFSSAGDGPSHQEIRATLPLFRTRPRRSPPGSLLASKRCV